MRCFGNPEHDRICDLCVQTQLDYATLCMSVNMARQDKIARLEQTRKDCKYRTEEFKDRSTYDICKKLPWPHNNCNPSEECLKGVQE